MQLIKQFFRALADGWQKPLTLKVIGSGALMLLSDYERGTKDSDVLRTLELDEETKAGLEVLAGPKSELAKQWNIYLDIVDNGLPFLPAKPLWHSIDTDRSNLSLYALDITDVVVSKLKRFNANDRSDIDAMIVGGHVAHTRLISRFESAVDYWSGDARAEHIPKYIRNLNEVEQDSFLVEPTAIDLPSWV